MPVLTKKNIFERLCAGELAISPLLDPSAQVSEGSVNVRLGLSFIDTKVRVIRYSIRENCRTKKRGRSKNGFSSHSVVVTCYIPAGLSLARRLSLFRSQEAFVVTCLVVRAMGVRG